MITEDKVLVESGALLYTVNYLKQIRVILFKQKTKSTVKYFAYYENAVKEAAQ